MKVSIVKSHLHQDEPKKIDVGLVLKYFRDGRWKKEISAIVKLQNDKGKEAANELKKKLPAVVWSGTFENGVKNENLTQHSGFACIDFDEVGNIDLLKTELKKDNLIYSFWISPRGNGIKALVKMNPIKDDAEHKEYYDALINRFKSTYSINPDEHCRNVSRLCYVGYDKDLFINDDSVSWTEKIKIKKPNKSERFKEPDLGGRNNALYADACSMWKKNYNHGEILQMTLQRNNGFSEPLPTNEIEKLVQSATTHDRNDYVDILELSKSLIVDDETRVPSVTHVCKIRTLLSYMGINGTVATVRLLTRGNISAIVGKQKSKKTMLTTYFSAAVSRGGWIADKFEGCSTRNKVLYFDTEQEVSDIKKKTRRNVKEIGGNMDNIEIFHLREHKFDMKRKIITEVIRSKEDIGLVVIDGIADLLQSVNAETESISLVEELAILSAKNSIHICLVIHSSRHSLGYARGHLGSELGRKCEVVINIEKDENSPRISKITATDSREIEFEPFEIEVGDVGIPFINEMEYIMSTPKNRLNIKDLTQ